MVKMSEQIPADALQPKTPGGQTSETDSAVAEIRGRDSTCARASACCGSGARTARQKIGGGAFFLALAALILAKIYGFL